MACVAVVQLISSANVKKNLDSLEPFFLKAREKQAKLIVLPENFAFMGLKETDKFEIAEELGEGPIQSHISHLAKKYNTWVIAGTIPLKYSSTQVSAATLVYDEQGKCVARYNKIHLFDVKVSEEEIYTESSSIARGDELAVVDTPIGRVGLSVCYDLRFPELYRQLVLKGAELFVVPSAFTAITGLAHWEILLRARAIENLSYVLAPNQGGCHESGRNTYGHSMIVEPWGKIISIQKNGPGLIVADIDLQRLRQLRQQFPCNDHHIL